MGDFTILGVPVSIGTMIYQAFIFTILVFALHKLCLKKIINALEKRKNDIENQLKVTEQYKEEAKKHLDEQTKLLEETRKEILKMRLNCKNETNLILKNARDEAGKIQSQAYEELKRRLSQGA